MKERQKEEDKTPIDDSDSDTSGSEESHVKFLFRSALDVGSTFLKILPDDEDLLFYRSKSGVLKAKVYLENIVATSTIAYLAWTSHLGDFTIEPPYGFIRPGGYQYVTFTFNSDEKDEVEKGLYFIKALPLAATFDIDDLEENVNDVFHEHNKRILFTLSTLSADYSLEETAESVRYDYHHDRDNLIYTDEYKQRSEKQKNQQKKNQKESVMMRESKQERVRQVTPDDETPEMSKSNQRDSDLLGIDETSKDQSSSYQSRKFC
jgi:hypothetical protein